jgi:hypothetical protein
MSEENIWFDRYPGRGWSLVKKPGTRSKND